MNATVRIANAQGFWGDQPDAAARLLAADPNVDYVTFDYLAEVSLSIMAAQRAKDPAAGYARDFVETLKSIMPYWLEGRRFKLIANAGGLNPDGCAAACRLALDAAGLSKKRIGVVSGDDVSSAIRESQKNETARRDFRNLETGADVAGIVDRLVSANAYLGADGPLEALKLGADVVVTGRVADPSMAVAAARFALDLPADRYDALAGATVAGHLIECGAQVTGGIVDDWLERPGRHDPGFPIVEVSADGSCVVTKPPGSGGRVDVMSVKEQLVYEIGDPARYRSPDCDVSFLGLTVKEVGVDRVAVAGALGSAPSDKYKVSACHREGFACSAQLVVVGRRAAERASGAAQGLLDRLSDRGITFERTLVERLGCGDAVLVDERRRDRSSIEASTEVVVRIAVADSDRSKLERFAKEVASLVTSGPPGLTGYAVGRPDVRPIFGYWPCLIARDAIRPRVSII